MQARIIFLVIAIALVVLLFAVPPFSVLYDTTLVHPPASYSILFSQPNEEERRLFRYGNSFAFYQRAEQALEQAHIPDPVILLPPQDYLNKMGVVGVSMAEPSEFYYYTGHKAVWASSPGVQEARWTFTPKGKEVTLNQIQNQEELDSLLKLYRPYLQRQ